MKVRVAAKSSFDQVVFDSDGAKEWLKWPQQCSCCGSEPNTEFEVGHHTSLPNLQITSSWRVPVCTKCKRHSSINSISETIILIATSLIFIGFFSLILFEGVSGIPNILFFEAKVFGRFMGSGLVLAYISNKMTKERCISGLLPVKYEGKSHDEKSFGHHIFLFMNPEYAEAFAQANGAETETIN